MISTTKKFLNYFMLIPSSMLNSLQLLKKKKFFSTLSHQHNKGKQTNKKSKKKKGLDARLKKSKENITVPQKVAKSLMGQKGL